MNGSVAPGIVFIVFLTALVFTCLVGGRRDKSPLYYSILGALVLPVWWFIGLIYALGPWHAWRTAGIGWLVAGPLLLTERQLGGHVHYLALIAIMVAVGFLLGLIVGTAKQRLSR